MTNPLRKSAWEGRTGEDRRHRRSGEFFGREIGDKGGHLDMEGLVPSHALKDGLREAVAK